MCALCALIEKRLELLKAQIIESKSESCIPAASSNLIRVRLEFDCIVLELDSLIDSVGDDDSEWVVIVEQILVILGEVEYLVDREAV